MPKTDPYLRQKNYFARIRAKAELFDHYNDMRVRRIRNQIKQLGQRGEMTDRSLRLIPYYLSFPQVQTVILPKRSSDVSIPVRSYDHGLDWMAAGWVATGDDWDVGVAAYAFRKEFPEDVFRFVGLLRGREVVYQFSESEFAVLDHEAAQHEEMLRKAGLWVTE